LTWCGLKGYPENGFPIDEPYVAQSPTKIKMITYDREEIWREVERIAKTKDNTRFSVGCNLYHNIGLFVNPLFFHDPEVLNYLQDYNLAKEYSTPLGVTVDQVPALKYEAVRIIQEEITAIQRHKK